MDDITAALQRHAAEIIAYRLRWQNDIIDERRELRIMALELKGLRGKALKAAGHIDRLNHAYDAFNEAAPAHAADVEGLTPQITALQDDLAFAAQVLGNSVSASNGAGEGAKQPPEKPVITAGEVNAELIMDQHTAISDTINRVALGPHPDQHEPSRSRDPEVADGASQTFRAAE